ncbi:CDP-alcohol phosphatidyltransferase family protein [Murinocardiopsis flavida]|uniref:CDP-alcohol phosphatidyltransferase family protein n=1 Tax=Murinocardiopsis flavida TaxID=645275 RepID=UPI001B802B65
MDPVGDRIWTIPNLLSILRLIGVPVFLYLVLVPQADWADWWALGLLAFAGVSDWLDGKIARAFNQASRLGVILDPLADRLYIFAALLGLMVRGVVPWWLMAILVLRDVLVVVALPILRHYGYGPLPVNFAGKAATLCLLYSFPLLLIAGHWGVVGDVAQIVGWAFAIWGTAIYWWAGLLYAVQGLRLIAQTRQAEPHDLDTRRTPPDPAHGSAADPAAPAGGAADGTAAGPTSNGAGHAERDPTGHAADCGPPTSDRKGATTQP